MSDLKIKILDTVKKMEKDYETNPRQPNFTPLRELEHYCNEYLFITKSPIEIITAFFFARHLNNVFLNLGGDTFFNEELKHIRKHIFLQFVEALKVISQGLETEDFDMTCRIFSETVKTYVEQINFLNQHYKI